MKNYRNIPEEANFVTVLLELRQRGFDLVEVRQLFRGGRLLAVLDDASLVDDEGSARGGVSYPSQHREDDLILLDHFLVQVASQRDANLRSEEHTSELQ